MWPQNCSRQDSIVKSIGEPRTKRYDTHESMCSNHIDDHFFIRKTNTMILPSRTIPTIFDETRNSVVSMNSRKNDCRSEKITIPLELPVRTSPVDQSCEPGTTKIRPNYEEPIFNKSKEPNSLNDLDNCKLTIDNLSIELTNLCRICGQSIVDGIDIFTDRGLQLGLREKILLHTPVLLEPEVTMPRKICQDCCDKLEVTHSLVVTCLRTDLKLRRFFNISSESRYDAKYADLVTRCMMSIANETSYERIDDKENPLNDSIEIRKNSLADKSNCKSSNNSFNTKLGQAELCPIAESSDDNGSNLKYATNPDLKNLLQALEDKSSKSDESNNRPSTTEHVRNSQFVCSNCKNVFETREKIENHAIMCKTAVTTNPSENDEFESNAVCPICQIAFDNLEYYKKHQITCENTSKLNCQNMNVFVNDDDLENPRISYNRISRTIVPNRCGYCSFMFETRKELQIHINDVHDGRPLYKCGICEKTYKKWSSLDVHEATHRIDKPYLCDLCGKSFKHSNNLRGHKRTHLDDSKKKRHACDVCGSAFRSRFHLREHMNQHNDNKPYTCEECGKSFHKRIQLRQHRLSHGTNKHACPICGVTFNRRGNMNTHRKRHDKTEGMYTCSVCEHKCRTMSELMMHRKQHTENDITESIRSRTIANKIWRCNICDKIFTKRAILLNHESTHTGDRATYECDNCGKKLATKSSLKYHNKSLHSTVRPHMCQYCGKAFVSKESRLTHERIHTGERPYTCSICKMQYRCSSNLSQHMKVHSSVKPHICQYCNKTFARKGALIVHVRIHTGLRPYVCELCGRSFSQKNDMIKHTRTHRTKSVQCEKCDEKFETKSELLKHLNLHEESGVENEDITGYTMITQPLESYALDILPSTVVEKTVELQIR